MESVDYHFEEVSEGVYRIEDVREHDIKFYGLLDFMQQEQHYTEKGLFQERLERNPEWNRVETRDASTVYVNSKYHTVEISSDITLNLQDDSFNSSLELEEAEAFLRGDPRAHSIRRLLS